MHQLWACEVFQCCCCRLDRHQWESNSLVSVQNREYVLRQPLRDEEFAIRRRDFDTIRNGLVLAKPEMPWTAPAGWAGIGACASGLFTFLGLAATGGADWVLATVAILSIAAGGIGGVLLKITEGHEKSAIDRTSNLRRLMDEIEGECAPPATPSVNVEKR